MYKIKKKKLDKYFFIKHFISGIRLVGKDIILFLFKKINLNYCSIKIDNNNLIFIFNEKRRFLLLNKKEVILILNFLKNKKYFCLPIKILKLKSFFKVKISICKSKE